MEIHNRQRLGKLTVLDSNYLTDDYQRRLALVQCDCGSPAKPVLVANLKARRTLSCGLCTTRGGVRKRPYKPRKTATPSSRAKTVTTAKVTDNGRQALVQ